jgi:hypothetical protein
MPKPAASCGAMWVIKGGRNQEGDDKKLVRQEQVTGSCREVMKRNRHLMSGKLWFYTLICG